LDGKSNQLRDEMREAYNRLEEKFNLLHQELHEYSRSQRNTLAGVIVSALAIIITVLLSIKYGF
jgi:hypothetical protein